jgi:hypothetical protein
MKTTRYPVDVHSTHDELLALFEAAEREDVDKGGRYDRRGAAITVWSHAWTTDATRHDSETIGTFSVTWLTTTASTGSNAMPVLIWQTYSMSSPSLRTLLSDIARMA